MSLIVSKRADLDGAAKQALETGRSRLALVAGLFVVAFAVVVLRLADVTLIKPAGEPSLADAKSPPTFTPGRADIVDRNGVLLATSLATQSLFANPHQVIDPRGAAEQIARVLPDLSAAEVLGRLTRDRSFVWIKRFLTPRQEYAVNALGIPGLYFQREERRVYPQGALLSHVLGFTGIDGGGLAGIEKSMDGMLREGGRPLRLSVDMRVQHILHDALAHAVDTFSALGGAGIVMDVRTGEVLAMVSLPEFDPNRPRTITPKAQFNRATLGVYEMGSTFKIFTTAMAIDSGVTSMSGGYDASHPIHVAGYVISDYHAKNRWLSVPEIFMYSSNIGSAKEAIDVGIPGQKAYLGKLGLLEPARIELPEIGSPLTPSPWREINAMTVAYGQGIAVTPLQVVQAAAAVVNGGTMHKPTLLETLPGERPAGVRVLKASTSENMRRLLRLVVTEGTGGNADADGYLVGGKTGTAEKPGAHGYRHKALVSSFLGAFPMTDPRYVVLALLDEPHGTKKTFGYATAGWVAAPVVKEVVARAAPLLGVNPVDENSPAVMQAMYVNIHPAAKRHPGEEKIASY